MSQRISMTALSAEVRTLVENTALCYKIVAVAIDVNLNEASGGYVALVHNRPVHDPFERYTLDMPFEITRSQQCAILECLRRMTPVCVAA